MLSPCTRTCSTIIYIYIYAFSRRFYPKRLTIAFRLYIFISTCVPWESNPQPFAQQTQCSTTEPHRNTIMLYISSATNDTWPHSLHFSLLLFLFVSHYQDSFSKTHNHLCSCSYHPEILTCVSSVLLPNVHTWINVCYLSSFCDSWGSYIVCLCFLNESIVKYVKNDAVFVYRVFQKTLNKLERVCK